mmetsp:Transcript_26935/g.48986  ORF Transcript_26935/g.48986 Transcript_26935/m.48986 type:complete len:244 (-) Transcript_26935:540-1271(-)
MSPLTPRNDIEVTTTGAVWPSVPSSTTKQTHPHHPLLSRHTGLPPTTLFKPAWNATLDKTDSVSLRTAAWTTRTMVILTLILISVPMVPLQLLLLPDNCIGQSCNWWDLQIMKCTWQRLLVRMLILMLILLMRERRSQKKRIIAHFIRKTIWIAFKTPWRWEDWIRPLPLRTLVSLRCPRDCSWWEFPPRTRCASMTHGICYGTRYNGATCPSWNPFATTLSIPPSFASPKTILTMTVMTICM